MSPRRRDALKAIGTGTMGTLGLAVSSTSVAASEQEWDNKDQVHDSWANCYHSLGASLILTNEYIDQKGDYVTVWNVSGDGVVNNEDKSFPAPEDSYNEVPDEVDKYPREMASGYTEDFSVDNQGLIMEVPSEFSVEGDFADSNNNHMFPDDGNENSQEASLVALNAAKVAANANPLVSGLISGGELAYSLYEFTRDDNGGKVYDLTHYYGGQLNNFLRGGFCHEEIVIVLDGGEYGTVDLTYEFGQASTGFEIYIQYDGMAAFYDVTKK